MDRRVPVRYLAAGFLGVVGLLAVVVPLARQLPAYTRIGGATRHLHEQYGLLGAGWLLSIQTGPPLSNGPGPVAWFQSNAPVSTVKANAGWRSMVLNLAPEGCRSGEDELVKMRWSPTQVWQTINLVAGFNLYRVDLVGAHATAEVELAYQCLPGSPSDSPGVDLAGIEHRA
jgi:hypothetical protein